MAEDNNISTRIRAYLEGRMSAEEQEAFEAERASNPDLDQEIKMTLLIRASLAQESQDRRREELKALLRSEGEDEQSPPIEETKVQDMRGGSKPFRSMWSYIAIAASILVLAGLIWNFGLKPQSASASELFAANYEVPAAPDQMGSPVAADSLLRLGHVSYNQKNYAEAKRLYESAIAEGLSPEKQPNLYLGIAALENNDVTTARNAFEDARKQLPERADWYLALLEIKEERIAEAKSLLKSIAETDGHFYQKKAKSLLKRL